MEEPPRIEQTVASRGISISDTASILQTFLSTLDHSHLPPQDHGEVKNTTTSSDHENWNTPRKSRQEIEEESILKQFDLISKQFESRLVSDDTYERLKLIRDSIVGEASGKPVLPSEVVKSTQLDQAEAEGGHNKNHVSEGSIDGTQQFLTELYQTEQDLNRKTNAQEEKEKRKEAKKAKKEKKAAKKAKKEAKRVRREKRKAESTSDHVGSKKRFKVEDVSL